MRQFVGIGDIAHGTDEISLHFQGEDTRDLPFDPYQQRGQTIHLGQFKRRAFRRMRHDSHSSARDLVASVNRLPRRPVSTSPP